MVVVNGLPVNFVDELSLVLWMMTFVMHAYFVNMNNAYQVSEVYYKNKKHSSCEIEDFVETHLCKLSVCDTPIARITGCVSSLFKDIGRRLPLKLQCSYQGQQGDVRQSVRGNYKTRF